MAKRTIRPKHFALTYTDHTEPYFMRDAILCMGDSVKELKEVIAHFDRRDIVWSKTYKDVLGRIVVVGDVNDAEDFDNVSSVYSIYEIKPPKHWKLIR